MPSPTTDVTVPAPFNPWAPEFQERARRIRTMLTGWERFN
jgi:hypothetical protein